MNIIVERIYNESSMDYLRGESSVYFMEEYFLIGDTTLYSKEEAEKRAQDLNKQYGFSGLLYVDSELVETFIEPFEVIELQSKNEE